MNKRYWKYFLNTLRYPEIQHGGALALLAEAEGGELDRLYDSGLKLRDQFLPALAEKESVQLHGRARGLPRHFLENDAQYRTRVLKAWAWQHLAGRHWGLHKIFAEYGFSKIRLTNLSGVHWAEFDLDIESPAGGSLGDDVWDLAYWLIFEYKRASAMLRTLRLVKRIQGRAVIRAALAAGEIFTLYPPPAKPAVPAARLFSGGKPVTHEQWRLGCDYCQYLPPPVFETPATINRAAITHEYWTLGGNA